MSKKKQNQESGFGKWMGRTIAVAVIFSAGLITGQRLIHKDVLPPLVSLSVTKDAQAASAPDADEAGKKSPLKTSFSFYEHLASARDANVPAISASPSPKKTSKPKAADPVLAKKPEAVAAPAAEKPAVAPAEKEPALAVKPVEVAKSVEAPVEVARAVEVDEKVAQAPAEAVAAEAKPEPVAPQKTLPARYSLQVGSHPSKAMATRELSRLRAKGLEAYMVSVQVSGKRLYRVRVGKFHSMDEVRSFQTELKEKRGVDGFISPI